MILSRTKFIFFLKKIKFNCIVLFRALIILFKRKKSIHLIQLDYHTKYIFKRSYFAVAYNFKNALWFEINGIKTSSNNTTQLFNRDKTDNPLILTVQGLFNKKEFKIDITNDTFLENKSFLTSFTNLSLFQYNLKDIRLRLNMPYFKPHNFDFNINPEITVKQIRVKHTSFKKSDYI